MDNLQTSLTKNILQNIYSSTHKNLCALKLDFKRHNKKIKHVTLTNLQNNADGKLKIPSNAECNLKEDYWLDLHLNSTISKTLLLMNFYQMNNSFASVAAQIS